MKILSVFEYVLFMNEGIHFGSYYAFRRVGEWEGERSFKSDIKTDQQTAFPSSSSEIIENSI